MDEDMERANWDGVQKVFDNHAENLAYLHSSLDLIKQELRVLVYTIEELSNVIGFEIVEKGDDYGTKAGR